MCLWAGLCPYVCGLYRALRMTCASAFDKLELQRAIVRGGWMGE